MLHRVLSARLRESAPANAVEQENALQELLQHYVLASLSRAGLFRHAIFHGGTCLRIVHAMSRFSEDLAFLLKRPDPDFRWRDYLESVRKDCAREGIPFEVQDNSRAGTAVQKAFLKADSVDGGLELDLPFERHRPRKIRIKLEVDVNPPEGSTITTSYITFPVTVPLTTQSLESGFALKLAALLCRPYVKGRDWYDFVWYVARKTRPDLGLLGNAVRQHGPWAGQAVVVDAAWVRGRLDEAIRRIDWAAAADDVQRFLPLREQAGLRSWSTEFFLYHLARMEQESRG